MLLKFETETEWLAAREKDVTSTEVAAIFGMNPYKSRLRLWNEKRGLIESDFEESPFSKWGKRLQIPVAMGICEDEGWQGFDLTGYYFHDPAINSGASLDAKAVCDRRGTGHLEIKIAERFREEDGWLAKSAPLHYEFQIHMQLHEAYKNSTPFDWGAIGALGYRQKVKIYFRQHDLELGEMMDAEIKGFWDSVRADVPPPPDYAVDGDLLASLAKPVRAGEAKNLSQNNRAVELIHSWQEKDLQLRQIRPQIQEIEAQKEAIKAELHAIMGNAETAIIGPFQVSAKQQTVEEYWNPGYKTRRFDVKQKKGK